MSDHKELISAFLDDGLSAEELKSINTAESKSDVASRYHLMGEALRGHVSDAAMTDICARVSQAIREENEQLAERPATVSVDQPRQPLFDIAAWFRPLGGLAVAASIALVMVFSVSQFDASTGSSSLVADGGKSNVNIPDTVTTPVIAVAEETESQRQQAINLDEYLAKHAEYAAQDTLQGRMPYARAVSYESK